MPLPLNPNHPARAARWGPWRLAPPADSETRNLKLLLLHGFCSSPRELRPLGLALTRSGFSSMAPLLPGHGEHYPGMNSCVLEDWLDAVHLSYEALRRDGSPVAVVGYCLGGSLALATARELNPRGLVCLATPLEPLRESLFEPLSQLNPPSAGEEPTSPSDAERPRMLLSTETFVTDCQSEKARLWRSVGAHASVTESFLAIYQEAIARASTALSDIRCPTFVVHAGKDVVVPPTEAEQLLNNLAKSELKRLYCSPNSGHALPIDYGRKQVYSEIIAFLTEIDETEESKF
jgi:carboxylesterase